MWEWNAWYNVGTFEGPVSLLDDDKALIEWFISEGYVNEKARKGCEIDDDQYNIVLKEKKTGKPMYAIEYGSSQI
jgi:hypothetical protein